MRIAEPTRITNPGVRGADDGASGHGGSRTNRKTRDPYLIRLTQTGGSLADDPQVQARPRARGHTSRLEVPVEYGQAPPPQKDGGVAGKDYGDPTRNARQSQFRLWRISGEKTGMRRI